MTTLEPISCPLCHGLGYPPKQCRNPRCPIDQKPAPPRDITHETAYGRTSPLSFTIRCF